MSNKVGFDPDCVGVGWRILIRLHFLLLCCRPQEVASDLLDTFKIKGFTKGIHSSLFLLRTGGLIMTGKAVKHKDT